jgi:ribosomal protein S20
MGHSIPDQDMTDALIVALGKLINNKTFKTARQKLEPGSYDVPVLVHGTLQVDVAEDYSRKGTSRIPYTVVIALLLKHAGYTKKSSVRTLTKVFREAHEMDKDAAKLLMQEYGLTEALTTVQKIVADSLPPIHAKGVVKVQSEGLVIEQRELTRSEAEALFPAAAVAEDRKLKPRKEEEGGE